MCLRSKHLPYKCEKDIICYKIFKRGQFSQTLRSPYTMHRWDSKKQFNPLIKGINGDILFEETYDHATKTYLYKDNFFHAFRWKFFAKREAELIKEILLESVISDSKDWIIVIKKCKIPAGSYVVKNFKEIAGTSMEILD